MKLTGSGIPLPEAETSNKRQTQFKKVSLYDISEIRQKKTTKRS